MRNFQNFDNYRCFFYNLAVMKNELDNLMLPCMNKELLGIDCPGCGTQRATSLLLQGDFAGAFVMFPAIYTTIFLFLLLGLHIFDKSRSYQNLIIAVAIINAVIMIFSYIYKMTNL